MSTDLPDPTNPVPVTTLPLAVPEPDDPSAMPVAIRPSAEDLVSLNPGPATTVDLLLPLDGGSTDAGIGTSVAATTTSAARRTRSARTVALPGAGIAAPPRARGAAKVAFPVSRLSPFQDGYDIASERVALRDLVDLDDPEQAMTDPRYARFEELQRREELLRTATIAHRQRSGANPEVSDAEAGRLQGELGGLTDEESDTMALHTRDAARLFVGRAAPPGERAFSQTGAKRVGAALRTIWYLSGNDNPYADYALIDASARLAEQVKAMETRIAQMQGQLDALRRRGLNFSVLRADPPVTAALGFRSPYGYSVVHLVSTFDYFVRVLRTLMRKDLMADTEGQAVLNAQSHACRSIFEQVVRFQHSLMHTSMQPLSRADWMPSADAPARQRVQAAVQLFGELPRAVFAGQVTPRHSRRRVELSAQELRLLQEVPLVGGEPALERAAAGLVQ